MNAIEFLNNNLAQLVQLRQTKLDEQSACEARLEQLTTDLTAYDLAITNLQNAINSLTATLDS